jgi:hypothetical protein
VGTAGVVLVVGPGGTTTGGTTTVGSVVTGVGGIGEVGIVVFVSPGSFT